MTAQAQPLETLLIVLGDQLDRHADALEALNPRRDAVWMAEVEHEISSVPSHKRRIALFLSAMRHFRDDVRTRGITVHYHALTAQRDDDRGNTFSEVLAASIADLKPRRLVVTRPGDWRVLQELQQAAAKAQLALEIAEDAHFMCDPATFGQWMSGRRRIVLEDFYRFMRKRDRILLTPDDEPVGGAWNFDDQNRASFGRAGPGDVPPVPRFAPDAITAEVLELVEARWPSHPGTLDGFAEPVTPAQAREALTRFVTERLMRFGDAQDALWQGQSELFHSRLSAVLNLKLLDPRDAIAAAETAAHQAGAPLNAVEGFIRQIVGWREFVRGIYWHFMPDYAERNALDCDDVDVPAFFWDADTDMACVGDAMRSVLSLGYAHHIQRLMVLGLFAQLAGVHPYRFHEWHMALYLDAVDWVSLPNTLGMSQFGDGGIVGTKPYCATGKYIDRQGNHCANCRYAPDVATGPTACPFTTLYWDFLARHRERLGEIHRMGFQLRNLDRKKPEELAQIRFEAAQLRERLQNGERC